MSNALGGFMQMMTGEPSNDIPVIEPIVTPTPAVEEEEEVIVPPAGETTPVAKTIEELSDDENPEDLAGEEEDDEELEPTTPPSTDPVEFDEELEGTYATSMFEIISEKLGIDLEDDEEMPTSFDNLTEKILDIISENSTPDYASDEIAKLDEFVKNGGDVKSFFKSLEPYAASEDDLKTESGQAKILKASLLDQGFTEEQADAKIDRYDLNGLLKEEAEDAYTKLAKKKAKVEEVLLKEQNDRQAANEKQQQEVYQSVVSSIQGLNEFNGVKVSKKEKTELVKYLFEKNKDGVTQWQSDSSNVDNIVKAALILKNGDSILNTAKQTGQSEAIKRMKNSLKSAGNSKVGRNQKFAAVDSDENLRAVKSSINKIFGQH